MPKLLLRNVMLALIVTAWVGGMSPTVAYGACGDGIKDGDEDCDDAGESLTCNADCTYSDCGDRVVNATAGEQCDDGNQFGGDGCAENCTPETVREFLIDATRSSATTQLSSSVFRLPLSGSIQFTTGQMDSSGVMPVVIRQGALNMDRIPVPGIACACVRTAEDPFLGPGNIGVGAIGCGDGGVFGADFLLTQDHNDGVVDTCAGGENEGDACRTDDDCPGTESYCFKEFDCLESGGMVEQAWHPHPGVCNGRREFSPGGTGPRGTMWVVDNVAFTLIFDEGTCCTVGVDPGCTDPDGLKGLDGEPCTDDDLDKGWPRNVPATTGEAAAAITTVDNIPGNTIEPGATCGGGECESSLSGEPFDCDALAANPTGGLATGKLAFAFQILDYQVLRDPDWFTDALVTLTLVARPRCLGDCDDYGTVTVDELIAGRNIALGDAPIDSCSAMNPDGNSSVEIGELVGALENALFGCPD
jgi:cysteine-rich repeat protein